jgi:hypothetical protein
MLLRLVCQIKVIQLYLLICFLTASLFIMSNLGFCFLHVNLLVYWAIFSVDLFVCPLRQTTLTQKRQEKCLHDSKFCQYNSWSKKLYSVYFLYPMYCRWHSTVAIITTGPLAVACSTTSTPAAPASSAPSTTWQPLLPSGQPEAVHLC